MLFRFLLLAILALAGTAEAQQACFGSSCPGAGGSSTVTSGAATSGFTNNTLIWNGASVLGSGPKFLTGNLSLEVGTNYCPDAGANDTYVCALQGGSLAAYSAGTTITLKANTANTGTATVAVDGLAAITITRRDDSALQTGDISAGDYVPLVYDGNTFRVQRGFQSGVTYDGTTFAVTGAATLTGPLSVTLSSGSVLGNLSKVQAVTDFGAYIGFNGGVGGVTNLGVLGFTGTAGSGNTLFTSGEIKNAIGIAAATAIQFGAGASPHINIESTGVSIIRGATTIGGAGITGTTVAATVNGGTSTGNSFQVQDNGTNVFTVADGGVVSVKSGGATTMFSKVGGTIADFYTDTSVGGAEADIYTTTLPASMLGTNGDKIVGSYGGNFVTIGTESTQLKVYFGGTAVWDSTALPPATGTTSWNVDVRFIRVSSTVVRYSVTLNTTGATGYVYATSGELTGLTLSNANILKLTGTSSGAGSGVGDIVGKMGYLDWKSAQ